jgi:tRNA-2-methylthio-N6-dimethylallyladenosine synthase
LVDRVERGERSIVETDFPTESKFDHLPEERSAATGASAFLTVQEGCDKFCSFCVVPYTRGAEESRPVASVVAEAERLAAQGVREITLLGQNVNAYHGEAPNGGQGTWNLATLLKALGDIDGLERLRFTTSHPKDMDEDLYQAFADNPKLMPYLHLPVQSGSDPILKAMNRSHTAAEYVEIIQRLRSIRPDMAISGDFIVGFPGESDQDFADTLKIITEVNYAQAYSFKYSPRPGTPAANVEFHVPEEVKSKRLEAVQLLLNEQQLAFNLGCVGKTMSILLERPGKEEGQLIGRSPYMQSVHVMAPQHRLGQLVDVEILSAGANSLKGQIKMAQQAA